MKETRDILDAIDQLQKDSEPVLATVVDVQGSSFRLPGARMLILEDGTAVGTVSGGCLEADVLENANRVRESGEPRILVYDTTNEEDSIFSLNMGCRGVIRILLQKAVDSPELSFLRDNIEHSIPGVIATLIDENQIGSQVIIDSNGVRYSGFSDASMTQIVMAEADRVLKAGKSELSVLDCGEVFFDYVPPPVKLVVFGAGAEAIPLIKFADDLGWKTLVIDHRPAYANKIRIPNADKILIMDRDRLGSGGAEFDDCLAVVMTHNYGNDKQIVSRLLETGIRYIGAMGPKSRTAKMFTEIESGGQQITDQKREKVHGPVGLDIGATTPEGIALSIIAEVQAFVGGREGGFLKQREGSIYGRN